MADVATVVNNSSEWFELADTALKIMGGASIAGVISYFITKANHNHDVNKQKLDIKIKMLDEATTICDTYFFCVDKLTDQWFDNTLYKPIYLNEFHEENSKRYLEIDKKYSDSIYSCNIAISKFNILGLHTASNHLMEYDKFIMGTRNDIVLNRMKTLTKEEFNVISNAIASKKKEYSQEISKYFESLK